MKPILREWTEFFRAHPSLFQFGQRDDESTFNGSTGCTHSNVQSLHLAISGTYMSQDEISKLCGYPWPFNNPNQRGMRVSDNPGEELNTCIRKLKLPYAIHFFASLTSAVWTFISERNNDGPVLTAANYSHIPRKVGKGPTRNGFAEIGGATQFGLIGGHSLLRLGYDRRTDEHAGSVDTRWHDWWHDPDHGSPSRPETPAFDRYLSAQGKATIESVQTLRVNGRAWPIMVAVPTRPVHPK
jgi:hypothetical protein